MAGNITHQFVSAQADDGNASLAQGSDWNKAHNGTFDLTASNQTTEVTPTGLSNGTIYIRAANGSYIGAGNGTGVIINADNVAIGQPVGTANSPTFTNATLSGLTANAALASDANGKIVGNSTTTATELTYVHGVTSAIQTQIDAKQATLTLGTVTAPNLTITGGVNASANGAVIISAPQAINTTASPTFANLSLTGIANNSWPTQNGTGVLAGIGATNGTLPVRAANGTYLSAAPSGNMTMRTNGSLDAIVGAGGSPASPNSSLQFNNSGSFGGLNGTLITGSGNTGMKLGLARGARSVNNGTLHLGANASSSAADLVVCQDGSTTILVESVSSGTATIILSALWDNADAKQAYMSAGYQAFTIGKLADNGSPSAMMTLDLANIAVGVSCPQAAMDIGTFMGNSVMTWWVDQTLNTLNFKVRYSDATEKSGSIALV